VKVRATRRSSRYPEFRITARSVTCVDRSAFCSTGGSGKPAPKDPEGLVAEPFGGSATKPTRATVAPIRFSRPLRLLARCWGRSPRRRIHYRFSTGNIEETVRPRSADMRSVEFGGVALAGDLMGVVADDVASSSPGVTSKEMSRGPSTTLADSFERSSGGSSAVCSWPTTERIGRKVYPTRDAAKADLVRQTCAKRARTA
jgi:hypothetical protein